MNLVKLSRLWKTLGPGKTSEKELIESLTSKPLSPSQAPTVVSRLERIAKKLTPGKNLGNAKIQYAFDVPNPNAAVQLKKDGKIVYPQITVFGDKVNKVTLAHELGHAYTHLDINDRIGLPPMFSIDAWLKGTKRMKNEMKASAKALRILKAGGDSPEQLKEAREQLKKALDSYRRQRFVQTVGAGASELGIGAVVLNSVLNDNKKEQE